MPKFMLLIHDDESSWASFSPEEREQGMKEYFAFGDEARQAGVYVAAEALQSTSTARTVRGGGAGGEATVTDGPYAETKEQLGGFYLLECKDEEEALAWARKVPSVRWGGSIEVRPVMEYEEEG